MAHATLRRITIYPIKSLAGLERSVSRFVPSGGLAHDREFALFDEAGQHVNGKHDQRVHGIRASFDPNVTWVQLASHNGEPAPAKLALDSLVDLSAWFSAYFGQSIDVRCDPQAGFPDDKIAPGPTIISTATLSEIASWFPGITLEAARARFRANLEIDGVPAFWEDRLYGPDGTVVPFSIGEALIEGNNPCARCVVPSRDAISGEVTPIFSKNFSKRREAQLPLWAQASRFNHYYRAAVNTRVPASTLGVSLYVGDAVTLA